MRNARTVAARDGILGRAAIVALAFLCSLAVSAAAASGQELETQLTLEDAIMLAKGNNPTFLSTQNDQAAANWQAREAYARFLPTVTANIGGTWQEAGAQRFGTVVFAGSTDMLYSGYGINLGMTLDGNTIFGVPNARANQRATRARTVAAEFNLESTVAFQYMAALRALDGVDVAQRQVDRAIQNRQLVNTRVAAGAAAGTEGTQAEVDLGRAEVSLIQARRDLRQARLLLAEQTGVPIDEGVQLSSEFEVFEPDFDVNGLLATALGDHPSLNAVRAQESATRAAARQTSTSQYLPSLRLTARFSGQAQQALNEDFLVSQAMSRSESQIRNCEFTNAIVTGIPIPGETVEDCSVYAFTPELQQQILSQNDAFPFRFESIPATVSATFSLPLFTGFNRQRQVAEANDLAEDAEHTRRAEELRIRTQVTNTYDNLVSAYQVVQAEARNRALAEEQLVLQQRRYALGAADLLLLLDAQTTLSTAEQLYLNAVYDFHYNLIALEAAVGQPLRSR